MVNASLRILSDRVGSTGPLFWVREGGAPVTERTREALSGACWGALYAIAACLAALIVSALLSGCATPREPQRGVQVVPEGPLLPYPDAVAVSPCVYEGPSWVPGLYDLRERAALCLHPDPRAP